MKCKWKVNTNFFPTISDIFLQSWISRCDDFILLLFCLCLCLCCNENIYIIYFISRTTLATFNYRLLDSNKNFYIKDAQTNQNMKKFFVLFSCCCECQHDDFILLLFFLCTDFFPFAVMRIYTLYIFFQELLWRLLTIAY